MEHNLKWKRTFEEREPVMEDDFWWKLPKLEFDTIYQVLFKRDLVQ